MITRFDDVCKSIDTRFGDVCKSIEFNSSVIQDLKTTISNLQAANNNLQDKCDTIMAENADLKKVVKVLKDDIIELKQYSRRCNLEISNLPESEKENLVDVLTKIDQLADTNIVDNLTIAHRIPTFNKDKPRSIIVQVNSKPVRDVILTKLKSRKLSTKEINNRLIDMPIYANEHLTPELKTLFFHARKYKSQLQYKFCWTKDGKIFLRKDESSKIQRIKSVEDLDGYTTSN